MALKDLLVYRRFMFFSIGSLSVSILEVITTIILTEIFNMWYMYSYTIALCLGLALLFFYHLIITFKKSANKLHSFLRFILLYACSYTFAWVLVFTTTSFGVNYIIPIIGVPVLLSYFNYKINKKWVFI